MSLVIAHDDRTIIAASNNADLYEAAFRSWGLRYVRQPFAFVGTDPPPPFYSNLTVLSPRCGGQVMGELQAVAQRFDGSVCFKDSFCEFELPTIGFQLLFNASWIWKPAKSSCCPKGWSRVDSPDELERWELAWKRSGSRTHARMFRDAMLEYPDFAFLGKMEGAEFVCGCIANVSDAAVGISNLFSTCRLRNVFAEATLAVASFAPRLPIVGYARGPQLEAALQAGYETTGGLRVMIAKEFRPYASSAAQVPVGSRV